MLLLLSVTNSIFSNSGAIQDQSQCPSPSTTQYTTPTDEDPSIAALSELCPDASSEQILQSLNRNRGDVNLAAQELLGLSQDSFSHGEDREIRSAVEDIHAIKLRSLLYRIAWWLLTFTSLAPDR